MFDMRPFEKRHYPQIDSTNSEALRLVRSGLVDRPIVISAEMQTAGRGSRGRSWASARGNVHATFVLPVLERSPALPMTVYPLALAVLRTLEDMTPAGGRISVKWPNDVLVDGRKVSGALHEVAEFEGRAFLAAGIGVNVAWAPDNLPDAVYPPTALGRMMADPPSAARMIDRLADRILTYLQSWKELGFQPIMREYHERAHHLNEEIAISLGNERGDVRRGIYRGIDESGALLLEESGQVTRLYSTEVFPSLAMAGRPG